MLSESNLRIATAARKSSARDWKNLAVIPELVANDYIDHNAPRRVIERGSE